MKNAEKLNYRKIVLAVDVEVRRREFSKNIAKKNIPPSLILLIVVIHCGQKKQRNYHNFVINIIPIQNKQNILQTFSFVGESNRQRREET